MSFYSSRSDKYIPVVLLLAYFIHPTAVYANDTVPVRIAVVQNQNIEQALQLTGTVASARSARLSPSTAGLVTVLNVDTGSAVETGDILLELDSELAKWEWQGSQASVSSTQLALTDARRRLKEAKALAPKQSIAETVVRDLASEVAEDEAALQRAQADAKYRKGVFDRHIMKAPFAGIVSVKHTELGEWVTPGAAVLELVATEDLHIDFQVSEDFLSAIKTEAPVTYTLGDSATAPRLGKIAMLVPVADPGARTFLVRVEPDQSHGAMSPGMSARAVLNLDSGRRGIAISRDAIIKYPDGRVVAWVVNANQNGYVVAEKSLNTGLEFDGMVEILQGLRAGDRVVVQGNERLRSGQRVAVLASEQD